MQRLSVIIGCIVLHSICFGAGGALPPGLVEGDVLGYSYVPSESWTIDEGSGICPSLMEYGIVAREDDDRPLGYSRPMEYTPDESNLGVSRDGRFFTLNGRPVFLQGLSYYGALTIETQEELTDDLDDMVADGFNWIRVWVYWKHPNDGGKNVSALTRDGQSREPYMGRLKIVLTECNKRGIIVDATIPFDGKGDWVGPRTHAEHLAAVRTLALEFAPWRNVYFDIANERDVRDARFVSLEQVGRLIHAIKVIDSLRLCTASGVPASRDKLLDYLRIGKVDFVAPHLPRGEGSSAETYGKVRQFVGWMNRLKRRVPIHLQEPFRRGYAAYNPTIDDFLRDCSGAKVAEAAGWCLHNGAKRQSADGRPWCSFNMNDGEGRLYAQLDEVERDVTAELHNCIAGVDPDQRRYQAEYSEQLPHLTGERRGHAWIADSTIHGEGFLNRGPHVKTVPAGDHLAQWRLRLDGDVPGNDVICTIDVVNGVAQSTLASRRIGRQDFESAGQWTEFELPFSNVGGSPLEFRTYWHGAGKVSLDWIDLKIHHAHEPITSTRCRREDSSFVPPPRGANVLRGRRVQTVLDGDGDTCPGDERAPRLSVAARPIL